MNFGDYAVSQDLGDNLFLDGVATNGLVVPD